MGQWIWVATGGPPFDRDLCILAEARSATSLRASTEPLSYLYFPLDAAFSDLSLMDRGDKLPFLLRITTPASQSKAKAMTCHSSNCCSGFVTPKKFGRFPPGSIDNASNTEGERSGLGRLPNLRRFRICCEAGGLERQVRGHRLYPNEMSRLRGHRPETPYPT